MHILQLTDNPSPRDVAALDDSIYEFNAAKIGINDGRLLAIFVKGDNGDLIAGLSGWTWAETCEIKLVWVHESARRNQLGTRMIEAAENEARVRGCERIFLSSHSFQAPEFYLKLGFSECCRLHDFPRGYDHIWFEKRLD